MGEQTERCFRGTLVATERACPAGLLVSTSAVHAALTRTESPAQFGEVALLAKSSW